MSALPAARLANMQARRDRILAAAAQLLAAGGYSALTLRAVAEAAGVTVPTLYNLIGTKEALAGAVIAGALDCLDRELATLPPTRGIARAEAALALSFAQAAQEPEKFRAVFRAIYEFSADAQDNFLGAMFRRAGQIYETALREAIDDGALRGQTRLLPLAHHVLHAVMESFKLWATGSLSLEVARARGFYALYITCLADAADTARPGLIAAMSGHEQMLDR